MPFLSIKVDFKSNAMDVSNGDTKKRIAQINVTIKRASDLPYHLKRKHSIAETRSHPKQELKLDPQM